MKTAIPIAAAIILLVALAVYFRSRSENRQIQAGSLQTAYPEPNKTYLGLRGQLFHGAREHLGLPANFPADQAWAVVMDWGVQPAVATVVAVNDGTASIYYSTGGGSIGGGQSHESIRSAAKNALVAASQHVKQLKPVTEFPLPARGQVFFYVLTDSGVYFGEGMEKDLAGNMNPLSDLGNAMQGIVTEYRVIETSPEKMKSK